MEIDNPSNSVHTRDEEIRILISKTKIREKSNRELAKENKIEKQIINYLRSDCFKRADEYKEIRVELTMVKEELYIERALSDKMCKNVM